MSERARVRWAQMTPQERRAFRPSRSDRLRELRKERNRLKQQRWRQENPERARAIRQRYEAKHTRIWTEAQREAARARARRQKRAKWQWVNPDEHAACVADIRKAKTIRGPDWIVCLGRREQPCGRMLRKLRATGSGAHLRDQHGFETDNEYRRHWGYSLGTSLWCEAASAECRARAKAGGNLRADAGLLSLQPRAKGRVMSEEFRLKQLDRPRAARRPDRDAQIYRMWALQSLHIEEVARQAGLLSQGRVHAILRRIFGLRVKKQVCFAHGRILTAEFVEQLGEAFGLAKREIARICKINVGKITFPTAHRGDRALSKEKGSLCLDIEKTLLHLLLRFSNDKPRHFRLAVSNLDDYYHAVTEATSLTRADVTIGRVRDLVARARRSSKDVDARRLLGILPSLVHWLRRNPQHTSKRPFEISQRFIADEYGVSLWIVEKALKLSEITRSPTHRELMRVILMPRSKATPGPRLKHPLKKRKHEIRSRVAAVRELFEVNVAGIKTGVPRQQRTAALRTALRALDYNERQILRGLERAIDKNDARIAGRWFVSSATGLQYSTVKEYDQN